MPPGNIKRSIKKIKGKDFHPYSRKATQLQRAVNRTQKMTQKKEQRKHEKVIPKVERHLYFKHAMDPEKESLEEEEVSELIRMYIDRNDEELESLVALHKKGRPRPKASREDAIILIKEKEDLEFKSGFLIPDLTDKENVKRLREWEGDPNAIDKIVMKRFSCNINNSTDDIITCEK